MADTLQGGLAGGLGAALAAGLPASLARALSIPADVRKGTIEDVAHVVILMQENRSFDHYFGTMAGVRGCQRFAALLPWVSTGCGSAWRTWRI